MLILALALQLSVVQMQPITTLRTYDVDLEILRGADTLAMPLLRLADGREGRLMLSPAAAPGLLLRAMVRRDPSSQCHVIQLQIDELVPEEGGRTFLPLVQGRLCDGEELIRLGVAEGGPGSGEVIARVRAIPVTTTLQISN